MVKTIGIRMEDKNRWERRTPLAPPDVAALGSRLGTHFIVEASPNRIFPETTISAAGATVEPELQRADLIVAIKEVPAAALLAGKVYVYFAHVVKGQRGQHADARPADGARLYAASTTSASSTTRAGG